VSPTPRRADPARRSSFLPARGSRDRR
jgi:hypothetical protein